jgi:hypothetical protein
VWDMQAFAAEMSKSVNDSQMTSSVKANGQSKPIAGQTASGYDMEVTVPSQLGEGGPKMTVRLVGPVWVVKDAPGTRDFLAFYRAAVDKGWIFSDPRAAKGPPGDGEGPMAAMIAKMGGMSATTIVQSVATDPLADDLFAAPAGYKLNSRK